MRARAIALLLTCMSFVAACTVNPATGRRQFIVVSSDQVQAMGVEATPQLIEEYGGVVPSAELRSYVQRVGRDLVQQVEPEFQRLDWEFFTLDSDVINAFALPGGKVFISRGLLERFDNEAQLAGVLGHEIGHVTGRHVDERISRATALEFGLSLGGQLTESQLALAAAELFSQGYLLSFSRDQEREADVQGLRYMTRAQYNPMGMAQVLRILADEGGGPAWEVLSTHPNPENRFKAVLKLIESNYSYTQNNPDYRMLEDRFQEQAAPHLARPAGRASRGGVVNLGWCAHCAAGTLAHRLHAR